MRLPRTLEGIKENGQILLAKMAMEGANDQDLEAARIALKERPKYLKGLVESLMATQPHFFEDDEWGTLDGVIVNPEKRAEAADSISKRKDLNSVKRFRMIDEINRTGRLLEE
jgi:hypothetical protein